MNVSKRLSIFLFLSLAVCSILTAQEPNTEEEKIYSGPQPGEPLVEFEVQELLSDTQKAFAPIDVAGDNPILLVFVHEVTRPGIGLLRSVTEAAQELRNKDDDLSISVVFLSQDPNETQQWAQRARRALPTNVNLGISTEGVEGPGAYGLNRKVQLTTLIGTKKEVTANFALVQPSVQADAKKIIEKLAETMEVEIPTALKERLSNPRNGRMQRPTNPMRGEVDEDNLRTLVRPLINKQGTQEQIDEAANEIIEACKESPALKKRIGEIARRIIDAGKLENYGNEFGQAYLSKWAKDFK